MANQQYDADIVVIGGGPGGYPAAIHAAKHGARVVIIDADNMGGTCLNWGCIPTKTLIGSVSALDTARHAAAFGVKAENVGFDFGAIMARKDKVVTTLVGGIDFLLKKSKCRAIKGKGTILDKNTVEVTGDDGKVEKVTTANIIIATGSVPAFIPIPGLGDGGVDSDVFFPNFESKRRKAAGNLGDTAVWTSNEAVSAKDVPARLVILGAGAVGTEFAYVYNGLGSKVTLVELMPNIVPAVDPEISVELRKILEKQGITILTSTKAASVDVKGRKLTLESEKNGTSELEFDKLLVAIGRRPFVEGLGLENVGIELERRRVPVDEYMRTSVPNIYAIGDVTGGKLALAHVATREGEVAADNALGHATKMDYRAIPAAVYTEPEVATVGLTEQEAKDKGYDVQIGKFSFKSLGKAMAINENVGLVKIVSEKKYGEILGASIVGPHASDLIHEVCVSMKLESTIEELMHTIHAHPSLGEAVMEAAQDVKGESVHK
ncbi:MAG TPA: dihydrolipoyl dehydrogenase [Capsulimonadaceae bacterium]|jgi:dihydrolipoamide dehydrogenase